MTGSGELIVHGYPHSVYTRAVRILLAEKNLGYRFASIDPFDPDDENRVRALHPFGRVPVLSHGNFRIYESAAILRYIDAAFTDPPMVPDMAKAAARMAQVMSIIDAYGYWPMVRQVFAQRVFRLREGEEPDTSEIAAGLELAAPVLQALDQIAAEGHVLNGASMTLADCHLAPMMAAFCAAPEGAGLLATYADLARWWASWTDRPSLRNTDTGFDHPDLATL